MDTVQPNAEPASADAQGQLYQLDELLQDLEAPSPGTHWGHVGSLAHLHELLALVIEHLQPSK